MEQFFRDVIVWMETVPTLWAYLVLLVVAYGENVVPPIPGDLVVVFGGYLVGIGRLDFALVVGLATLGGAVGFMTMYAFGARLGHVVMDPKRLRWLPKEKMFKVRAWLKRWGYGVVAANRFLSGARSVIALTVGMAHMNGWKTTAFATLSAAAWTALITYAGYAVGENWPVVQVYLRRYGLFVLAALGLFAVVQLVRFYRRRRAQDAVSSDET